MNIKLLELKKTYENDPEDFQIPYSLYGKTDLEVMSYKYDRLRKTSYGYIVRLGLPDIRGEVW